MSEITLRYQQKPIQLGEIEVELIWFDSMGAKSSSLLIHTPDTKIFVDPGVAVMQPSYPLSDQDKLKLKNAAFKLICKKVKEADYIFISHYHYDHLTLPSEEKDLYKGKTLWIKDPNQWINHSQWERAREFLYELHHTFIGKNLDDNLIDPLHRSFDDPIENLNFACMKNYGDYQKRREELLAKGQKWFERTSKIWSENPWVKEFKSKNIQVIFADGKEFKIGKTKVRVTPPLFHGIEYDRVGWIIALVLEYNGKKVLYTSDLQGPFIEDYAEWIIDENPDLLILDGPATYLLGYMVNRINLQRAIDNAVNMIKKIKAKIIIYDHHLLRDHLYKKRMSEVYKEADKNKKQIITAAEWLGKEPLILKLTKNKLKKPK